MKIIVDTPAAQQQTATINYAAPRPATSATYSIALNAANCNTSASRAACAAINVH